MTLHKVIIDCFTILLPPPHFALITNLASQLVKEFRKVILWLDNDHKCHLFFMLWLARRGKLPGTVRHERDLTRVSPPLFSLTLLFQSLLRNPISIIRFILVLPTAKATHTPDFTASPLQLNNPKCVIHDHYVPTATLFLFLSLVSLLILNN